MSKPLHAVVIGGHPRFCNRLEKHLRETRQLDGQARLRIFPVDRMPDAQTMKMCDVIFVQAHSVSHKAWYLLLKVVDRARLIYLTGTNPEECFRQIVDACAHTQNAA